MTATLIRVTISAVVFLLLGSSSGIAAEPELHPWTALGTSITAMFRSERLGLQLSTLAATSLSVVSGLDAEVQAYFDVHRKPRYLFQNIYNTGFVYPAVLGLYLYVRGRVRSDPTVMGAGSVVLQATFLSTIYTTLLKGLSGRPSPASRRSDGGRYEASDFYPGLGRMGFRHGWPSGHVSATAAMFAGLASYYPTKEWLRPVGVLATGVMGLTVLKYKGGVHWFSDALAGAVIGTVIGISVGRTFRQLRELKTRRPELRAKGLIITATAGPYGVGVRIRF